MCHMRKVGFVGFIAAITVALLLPVLSTSAQEGPYLNFTSLDHAACTPGEYPVLSFNWGNPEMRIVHVWSLTNARTLQTTTWVVPIEDVGDFQEHHIPIENPVPDGTQVGDTLTQRAEVCPGVALAPALQDGCQAYDSDSVSWKCGGLPGCDTQIPIPSTAVVGAFTQTTPVYWAPGKMTDPVVSIEAGKTAWVLGLDATGQYYKIVWVCDLLWVPVNTIGPNYDAVWNGAPLPTGVVE